MKIKNKMKRFFAVIAATFCLVVPCFMGNTSSSTSTSTVSDTSTLLNKTIKFKTNFDIYDFQGGMGSTTFDLDFFVDYVGLDGEVVRQSFTSLVVAMDYYVMSGNQFFYDDICVFDNGYDHDDGQTILPGWINESYRTITIIGGSDVASGNVDDSISALFFFYGQYSEQWIESIEDYVPPVEEPETMDFFGDLFEFFNNMLFNGNAEINGNSYISLICLILATVAMLLTVCLPFLVVWIVIRFISGA